MPNANKLILFKNSWFMGTPIFERIAGYPYEWL